MPRKIVLLAAAAVSAATLGGCGGGVRTITPSELQANARVESTEYRIGSGDSLLIHVFDQPELTITVTVRPDGKISTPPRVEDLQAAGRTPVELARDIEAVLSEYVRTPVVTVIPQGFVGEIGRQIRVVGEAVQPRALQYRDGMTILDVIIEVGGLSELASANRARVVRIINGQETAIRIRLGDLLNEGRRDQNIQMLPGDILVIPRTAF